MEHLILMRANFEEELVNHGELTLRDRFVDSLCPDTQGMHVLKLAIALILCSCSDQDSTDTSRVRGASHMLLVGDPGLGKSKLMSDAAKASPVSVSLTGFGCTDAGLLGAMVKDENMWQMEPGALALADKGVCIIDEFSMMPEPQQQSLLQAMEQQCVNIAKAGVVTKMTARCSILAGMNPKNQMGTIDDNEEEIPFGMHGALLSRFDLVFVMVQQNDHNWQKSLTNFIFNLDEVIE